MVGAQLVVKVVVLVMSLFFKPSGHSQEGLAPDTKHKHRIAPRGGCRRNSVNHHFTVRAFFYPTLVITPNFFCLFSEQIIRYK